jgi:phosphonate transport system permease protein
LIRQPLRAAMALLALALLCAPLADLEITTREPWPELARLARGAVTPRLSQPALLAEALGKTLGFALLGVAAAAACGFLLALGYSRAPVRWTCSLLRSVHELFWALLFLQALGLSPLTGILAIAIPYAATCAKVYAEILERAEAPALAALPAGGSALARFCYARLPEAWPHLRSYTSYRIECGLRSSAVLGFVGLPTLGFHLHSFFKQGAYSDAWGYLYVFYALIASLRLWVRPRLIAPALLVSLFVLRGGAGWDFANLARFLTSDIVPAPLRAGGGAAGLMGWLKQLVQEQALPGAQATLVLTVLTTALTGLLALALFPWAARSFVGRAAVPGQLALVAVRSTPEYVLAYVGLQLLGPSMLPAALALALHNGGIIGHLLARQADALKLRPDAPRGLDLWGYEVLPRLEASFLAFLFYRAEVILRETAILGILGVRTLGFFVDSAIAEIRLDRAVVLIALTALLNVALEALLRRVRVSLAPQRAAALEEQEARS